jgi:hypothetical protein
MRYVAIGDVHGCLEELKRLIALLPLDAVLVFVGDLLDKGPDSVGVVKYLRELSLTRPVILIEGNHCEKHRRFRRHEAARKATGKVNPMTDPKGVYASTAAGLSEADVAFLDSARLFYRVPGRNVLVVHAGVAPCVEELPGNSSPVLHSDLKGKVKETLGSLLRVRWTGLILPSTRTGRICTTAALVGLCTDTSLIVWVLLSLNLTKPSMP